MCQAWLTIDLKDKGLISGSGLQYSNKEKNPSKGGWI
jgi:hypothetical protein